MSLRGKVVVITGASSGIGREAALVFACHGANLVIAARRVDRLAAVRLEIEAVGALCLDVVTDVADEAQVDRLAGAAIEHFGRIDVWVNNAGYGLLAAIEEISAEDLRRILDVNLIGVFHGCRAALRAMRRQGGGHILNVSSLAGKVALPLNGAYAATKFAVNALGQALAEEVASAGIHVSTIMPGVTDTPFFSAMVCRQPPAPARSAYGVATAASVARQIVRCAESPGREVMLMPAARMLTVLLEAIPPLRRTVCQRYLRWRTGGRGVCPTEER